MCFAPQLHALFRHLNFQKWSEREVIFTFSTCKCASRHNGVHFFLDISTSVRTWCVLWILTWKFASSHNGVQFFISHLASWLRTRRFSEPTFRPSGATNHWKNTVFRDFPTFSPTCIFFLLTLSLLWSSLFCSSLLYILLLHLCFSSVHIVGSLTLNFLRTYWASPSQNVIFRPKTSSVNRAGSPTRARTATWPRALLTFPPRGDREELEDNKKILLVLREWGNDPSLVMIPATPIP